MLHSETGESLLPPSVLLQAATVLAQKVREEGIEGSNGRMNWPTAAAFELASPSKCERSPVMDGSWDLYNGTPGIAVFLAAYVRISGDESYQDLCLRALAPIREAAGNFRASASTPGFSPSGALGALVGVSSWIYALLVVGRLMDAPIFVAEAHALSSLITPDSILADTHFDLVFGSAGALLVLLLLENENPAPNLAGYTPLELASLCARKLLASGFGQKASMPVEVQMGHHFGLSHGLAGIGLALSRFHRWTHDPEAGRVSRGILNSLLQLVSENAIHPRSHAADSVQGSWCHGAPGLSVALVGFLESDLEENVFTSLHETLRRTIKWVRETSYNPQDHLCCGNMGRVAALAYCSLKTGDPELFEAACHLGYLVLRVAKTRGRFALDYPDRSDTSLFRGYAGIGYTLLTLVSPHDLPQVIALE